MARIAVLGTSSSILFALLLAAALAVGSTMLVVLAVSALLAPACVPATAVARVSTRRATR